MPKQVVAIGSGFPIGMGGAMCACGAVSDGISMIGYFFW